MPKSPDIFSRKRGLEIFFSYPKGIWKKEFFLLYFWPVWRPSVHKIPSLHVLFFIYFCSSDRASGWHQTPHENSIDLSMCWSSCLCSPVLPFLTWMKCGLTTHANTVSSLCILALSFIYFLIISPFSKEILLLSSIFKMF